ncbi:MAG TPA: tetratricopeptide repeat protein, partial [Gemmataceae bacterium]|nr:tetratricopeptide repeat protein [Gemmataceae bacterium]
PDHPDTLTSMGKLASSYAALHRHADASKLHEQRLTLAKARHGMDHQATLAAMNGLAAFLATASDLQFRDPARAVELATKTAESSTEKSVQSADYRGTLGVARYRSGDWSKARADLEMAIGMRQADDWRNAPNGFFLAMSHWQLGDKAKAREWFDRAVQWVEKGKKDDPELKRFRAEAAELLGAKGETTK